MVMGFKNSPQILQRTMDKIFEEYRGNGIEIYMDDIVIHVKTKRKHDELLIECIKQLSQNKMRVNINKIQFFQESIKLLCV